MDLLELARERFGKLSEAEEKLFQAVVEGKVADYSAESDADNDPAGAADWSEERVLDAQRIVWLCIDPQASALVTHRGIRVTGARIDGDLDLSFAEVQSLLRLLRCAIRGRIDLIHTAVRMLVLSGTHTGPITADGLKVQGGVLLREGFKAAGELRLLGATIGGNLECNGGEFVNQQGHALSGDGLKVEGSVFLREGFKAEGEVGLLGATIGRNLDCSGASFLNQAGRALTGDGLKVEGNVLLGKGFKAAGEVRLSGARIGGTLACIAGEFVNQDGNALRGDRLKVEGSVFLREGFKAAGEVRLLGATIGGNLECEDSEFANKEGVALNADRLKVHGNVFLRDGFNVNGAVSLVGASIEGAVVWRHVSASTGVTLDLRHARIRTLLDESASWPAPGKLHIDGLVYDHIREPAPIDAQSRIEWLRRQPEDPFHPQPYEQLAAVLRKDGHNAAARRVLIAKEKDQAKKLFPRRKWGRARLKRVMKNEWWWYRAFGPMIGYGYRPWLALWRVLALLAFGCVFFGVGWWADLITATDRTAYVTEGDGADRQLSKDYQTFNCVMYSLDAFVPLVDLHQTRHFLPNPNRGVPLPSILGWLLGTTGGALRVYMWVHIGAGWTLTTLLVVGLTGLVRK